MLAPAHLADVDQTLYTRLDLYECTVVGHYAYAALDVVAGFEIGIEIVPGMGLQLLQTKGYALLLVVEVDDNHVDLLVELYNLFGIAYAAPAEVCDMDKTVHAAEVNEYAVRCDVLDNTFQYLTLLKLGDDLFLLLFKLCLDEGFV